MTIDESFFLIKNFKRCSFTQGSQEQPCAHVFWSTQQLAPHAMRCRPHRKQRGSVSAPQLLLAREHAVFVADSVGGSAQHSLSQSNSRSIPSGAQTSQLSQAQLTSLAKWNVRLVPSIPHAARRECAETLQWITRQRENRLKFSLLLVFGKAVLRAPASAGVIVGRCVRFKSDQQAFLAEVLAECTAAPSALPRVENEEFLEGAFDDLDDLLGDLEERGLPDLSCCPELSEAEQKKVESLFKLGQFARAAAVLRAQPLAPFSGEVCDLLTKMHPRSEWSKPPLQVGSEPKPSCAVVSRALQSFAKGTAAGAFGIRPDHLRELAMTPGVHVLPALSSIIGDIINGLVPTDIRPLLFGARLVALFKRNEAGEVIKAVRPVACGEALRRLACKIVAKPAVDYLKPLFLALGQAGFGVPDGVQSAAIIASLVIQKAINGLEDGRLTSFLKTDLSNAFNMCSREAFVDAPEIAAVPSLQLLTAAIYGSPTYLFFGDHVIRSEEGTQQGCPFGGILFAVVLLRFMKAHVPLRLLTCRIWIADDGFLAGEDQTLAEVLAAFREHGPRYGLMLNMSKCTVYTVSGHLSVGSPLHAFEVKVKAASEAFLLGNAVGCQEARNAHADLIASRIESYNARVASMALDQPQAALCLLRSCSSFARANYFMRAYGPMPAWERVDQSSSRVLAVVCPGLSQCALTQCSLPCRSGGLGIRSCVYHAPGAFVAARAAAAKMVSVFTTVDVTPFDEGCTSFCESIGFSGAPTQRKLSQHIDGFRLLVLSQDLSEGMADDPPQRAIVRLAAAGQKGASLWLAPSPETVDILTMSPGPFRAYLRMRLGLPLFAATETHLCPRCRRSNIDVFGDHILLCLGGGAKTWLHHQLRDVIISLANTGLLHAKAETHSYEGCNVAEFDELISRMRADIALVLDDGSYTIDVTATHALRQPFLTLPDMPVERIAREKREAQEACNLGPRELIAAFDTFGGSAAGTTHTLKRVAAAYAARFDCPKEASRRFWASIHRVIVGWAGDQLAGATFLASGIHDRADT
jgi:hypothetical protein